jgi:hypothetical protein
MGVLAYGYDSAFIGTTITQKSFLRDFGMDQMTKKERDDISSNLTSICTTVHPSHPMLKC